jgi:predicted  nucleic acid-binding Zn-ribbon protein
VNPQVKSLVELQAQDTLILGKTALIKEIPKNISTRQKPLDEARARLEAVKKEHDAAVKARRKAESTLEEMGQRIAKLKARTDIKTNKEYQAHLKEIESAEKESTAIEDQILLAMEEVEKSEKVIKTEGARVKDEEGKLEEYRKELDAQAAEAEKDLSALKKTRAALTAGLDPELYQEYMKLLRKNSGLAVVEVKNEICQGCMMNIMPQLFLEIKRSETEIFNCPQCGRILYHKDEKVEEPVE